MAATAAPKPEGHIRKRQFQPSITSYFNARDVNSSQLPRPNTPLSPPLPADTQASLLSVGMRVRKSVPEGYKTHKTLGAAGFPFPSTAPPITTLPAQQKYGCENARELTPFCGLHKTGGWGAQEVPSSSAPAAMQKSGDFAEEYMDVPELMMSQNALSSTQGSFGMERPVPAASRKRTYEDEAEEEMDAFFDEIDAEETAEQQTMSDDRPIAKMKGTSVKARVGGPVRIVGEDDFEEASFLAPLDGMEVDEA